MKTIGNLNSKTNEKRRTILVQEQPISTTSEGIDCNIPAGSRQLTSQPTVSILDALQDGLEDLVLDQPIATYNSQPHS